MRLMDGKEMTEVVMDFVLYLDLAVLQHLFSTLLA